MHMFLLCVAAHFTEHGVICAPTPITFFFMRGGMIHTGLGVLVPRPFEVLYLKVEITPPFVNKMLCLSQSLELQSLVPCRLSTEV